MTEQQNVQKTAKDLLAIGMILVLVIVIVVSLQLNNWIGNLDPATMATPLTPGQLISTLVP